MNQRLLIDGDPVPVSRIAAPASALESQSGATFDPVIVVGGGPVGIRTAQELSRRGIDCIVFNAERWLPYNRVKLTPLLCGDAQIGNVMQPLTFPGPGRVTLYSDQSIVDVDASARTVTSSTGRIFSYAKLVFCTGSRAHVPPIPGRELAGVFTFRSADDVEKLIARTFRSRCAVVIGGGLLGLEAARGMSSRGTQTWIVEHTPYLMSRQLDAAAGGLLGEKIEALGLKVRTGASVASIDGTDRVEGLTLSDGATIACDTVIICTGIRANIDLAREIGLPVGMGIKVDSAMRTANADIFAAGECAEFDGNMYGLVGPGFEQALVAAANISGEPVSYHGSVPSTKLKIIGIDVFSMGDVEQIEQRAELRRVAFADDEAGIYRAVVMKRSRIVGAIAIGDWPEINRVQEAVRIGKLVMPWDLWRFRWQGRLWREATTTSVHEWPRAATICNCTGVTRGQIGDALALGATTVEDIKRDTGASTVCGSCRVHVEALLGAPPVREPVAGWKTLLALSMAAIIAGLITLSIPRWPLATSIANVGLPERLWLDGTWKQISGYTLLALSVAAAVLSLRKRVRAFTIGGYDGWRVVHAAIGAFALAALFVHTGFRMGIHLNAWLMSTFLVVALAGGATSLATALAHRLGKRPEHAEAVKSTSLWIHILAFWPLPLLLTVHVLSVYFY